MMDMLEIPRNGSRDVGNPPEHPAPFRGISYIFNRSGGFSTSRNVAKSPGTDPFRGISTSVPGDFEAVPGDCEAVPGDFDLRSGGFPTKA